MTGHTGIGGYSVVVIDAVDISRADTAVGDRDPDFMLPQFRWLVSEWL
jgi:hypothetical protein